MSIWSGGSVKHSISRCAMAADPKSSTLLKLLDALREVREKEDAILAEMATLIDGGEGVGAKLARLKAAWQEAWAMRYHSPYTFTNHAMVGASLKRFLRAHDEAEIVARMFTYVKSEEAFYLKVRHSFEVFVKGFNSFVGLPRETASSDDSAQRARELRGQ